MSSSEQGRISAELAVKILKKDFNIPFITVTNTIPIFNYLMLKKYNIPLSILPENSKILNKPKSFIEGNQTSISIILLILPIIIILLLIIIANIIHSKKIEKKLTIQNAFDEILLLNIDEMVFCYNLEEEIIKFNNLFSKIIENPKKNIIGEKVKNLIPSIYKKIKNNTHLTQKIEFTYEINKKTHWFLLDKYNIKRYGQNLGFIVIIHDITKDKRRAEEKLRSEQFLIQQSKQAEVGEMIMMIAHQWKTPLVEISILSQKILLLYKKKKINEKKIKAFVDSTMEKVIYMEKIINDFRDFIAPSNKKEIFEIKDAVSKAIKIINQTLVFNSIKIIIIDKTDDIIYINEYKNEFIQIIINIINNARESINSARESINNYKIKNNEYGTIKIIFSTFDKSICINIIDDGLGLSKNILSQAFNPFFTTKESSSGDGLGLYMAKLIIEDRMNGKIFIKNEKRGANVILNFEIALKRKESNESLIT